jgi:2-keto-4-pentenoate hydratase
MDDSAIERAAALLLAARRTRTPLARLPEDCRPATVEDALRIQAATVAQSGERVAGWKVGAVQEGRVGHGVILASRVVASGASVDADDVPLLGMEPEVAFRFLRDAPARDAPYAYDEVAERVVAFPAIEIVATRYVDYKGTPAVERLADCMSNGGFVAGADRPDWRSLDLVALPVALTFDGTVAAQGVGGHVAGDPLLPAVALVNDLRTRGGVRAGQVMTTGTYTAMQYAKRGARVRAAFEGFGAAEVRIV